MGTTGAFSTTLFTISPVTPRSPGSSQLSSPDPGERVLMNACLCSRDIRIHTQFQVRMAMNKRQRVFSAIGEVFRDGTGLSLELFKIMVPILIAVKILQELHAIRYLARPLAPLMGMVGLPAEMGLVWATAIVNNLYSAIVVLLSLIRETPLSTSQVTVLCTMMLVAHTMPVELKIAQKSGPGLLFQAFLRFGAALLLGWLLHFFYGEFDLLGQPAKSLFSAPFTLDGGETSLLSWAGIQARNLISIYFIILSLLAVMRILKYLGIIEAMNRLLQPVLKMLGIGPKASAVTVTGLTLGLVYGGGLIIYESRSGQVARQDVFYSLSLMGLSHALIEDTLLMMMVGGHLSGLLWARLAFSLVVVAILVKITAMLPEKFCNRFLWGEPERSGAPGGPQKGGRK